jgi:hypothetical protein
MTLGQIATGRDARINTMAHPLIGVPENKIDCAERSLTHLSACFAGCSASQTIPAELTRLVIR